MHVPPGWRLRVEAELPSTQDLLTRLAAAGEPEGLAILARRQTAGRGREARGWETPLGNLSVSVLLRPAAPAREAPRFSLLAGLAFAEALAGFLPDPAAIRLKWPNDLLLGEAKLGGLLCESAAGQGGGIEWLVMGFGANLAHVPAVEGRAVACLGRHAPMPEDAAAALLRQLDHWRAKPFAAVRAAWMARGPAAGSRIAWRSGARRLEGVYAGLAEDGSLLIETGAGAKAVGTGETGEG